MARGALSATRAVMRRTRRCGSLWTRPSGQLRQPGLASRYQARKQDPGVTAPRAAAVARGHTPQDTGDMPHDTRYRLQHSVDSIHGN